MTVKLFSGLISSKDNPKVKQVINYKTDSNFFFVEGIKIIEEILKENVKIKTLIYTKEAMTNPKFNKLLSNLIAQKEIEYLYVTTDVFRKISDVEEPQEIAAIVHRKTSNIENFLKNIPKNSIFVALDRITDPGNLGTIIRTCKSANVTGLIISKNSVSLYNQKVIRATMGAFLGMCVIDEVSLHHFINELKEHSVTIITTDLKSDKNYYEINYNLPVCFVFGNESTGISKPMLKQSDFNVKIPILSNIDSLNVAVTSGIIIYEAIRRFKLYLTPSKSL
ncbi:MAG: RNA methyltransferase [Candidatus Firestonebacteria bacterium]